MKATVSAVAVVMGASLLGAALTPGGAQAQSGELQINTGTSFPQPREAWNTLIDNYNEQNPDVQVSFNITDHEGYKTQIRNMLVAQPPDIVTWFAGNRMRTFVERDLLMDLSDFWADQGLNDTMTSARSAVSVNGNQYGLPWNYYNWGVYYRTDIFEEVGVDVPETWEEFLQVSQELKDAGYAPIAMGNKNKWTAAGWFDYLNMRINGPRYHMDLLTGAGDAQYTDEEVREVFDTWRTLLDRGFYIEDPNAYDWQEGLQFMNRGDAAMYLIGSFMIGNVPEDQRDLIDFFQFPVINPDVPIGEDAPMDTIHIPAGSDNKELAMDFLAFAAQPEQMGMLARTVTRLSPHSEAPPPEDRLARKAAEMLANADFTAQFYDRDTPPEMASEGMDGFQEFIARPDRIDRILERLERTRQRVLEGQG